MPTKPSTLPSLWAESELYGTGPFVGSATKADAAGVAPDGHRPGADYPTAAEHQNWQQYWEDRWIIDWLATSSATGTADTHLVQTTAAGRTGLTGLDVNNPDALSSAVIAFQAGSLAAFFGRNDTGPVYRAITSAGPGPAFRGDLAGSATGLNLTMTTMDTGTGSGIKITANAATTAPAIDIDHSGTDAVGIELNTAGTGLSYSLDARNTAGSAIRGTSSSAIFAGCWFTNDGAAPVLQLNANGTGKGLVVDSSDVGIDVNSSSDIGVDVVANGNLPALRVNQSNVGSSGDAILVTNNSGFASTIRATNSGVGPAVQADNNGISTTAIFTNNGNGKAVSANSTVESALTATSTSGDAIRAVATSGNGIFVQSSSNYAAWFTSDTTSPVNGTIFCSGINARPSSNTNGQLSYNSTELQWIVSNLADADHRGVWSSRGGFCQGWAEATGVSAGNSTYVNLASVAMTAGNAPKVASRPITLRVTLRGVPSNNLGIASPTHYRVRIRDVTANSILAPVGMPAIDCVEQFVESGQYSQALVSFTTTLTPTAAGSRTYRVEAAVLDNWPVEFTCQLEILGQN